MIRTLIAAMLLCAVAIAAGGAVPSIDQSLGMKTVSGARISPDGRFVAYLVQEPNWDENEFVQQIWIAVTATGEHYALTSARKSSTIRAGRRIRAGWRSSPSGTASGRSM